MSVEQLALNCTLIKKIKSSRKINIAFVISLIWKIFNINNVKIEYWDTSVIQLDVCVFEKILTGFIIW
jgi:hypothetical protein